MSLRYGVPADEPARDQGVRAVAGRLGGEGLLARVPPRLLDYAERIVFVVALGFFALANARPHQPLAWLVLLSDALIVFFLLLRRSTDQVSQSLFEWTIAFCGTLGPLLMRPGGQPLAPAAVTLALVLEGVALQIAAKLSLNVRFGIAPANRGVQRRWAYRLVRHPMYLGYLLMHTGYLLAYPTRLNLAAWSVTLVCQVARILAEERFLLQDPDYRAYTQRVRFRLIPLLF
jgi:protein-S-isoprenylcysteine O-methyltransferase Ste14